MALLGEAAVAVFNDMADPAAHDHWHSHEHLPERLGIAGFRRGRRCITTDLGAPRYFVLYEVRDIAVTTSRPYLDRLNDPTPWAERTMAAVRSMSRTLCRVSASHGAGVGAHLLALCLKPADGRGDGLRQWLIGNILPPLAGEAGLTGAHLLERHSATVRPETKERALRPRSDAALDWIVLIEGYEPQALMRLAQEALSVAELTAHGAAGGRSAAVYQLAHLLASDEVRGSERDGTPNLAGSDSR
jgi:hypothetical protein